MFLKCVILLIGAVALTIGMPGEDQCDEVNCNHGTCDLIDSYVPDGPMNGHCYCPGNNPECNLLENCDLTQECRIPAGPGGNMCKITGPETPGACVCRKDYFCTCDLGWAGEFCNYCASGWFACLDDDGNAICSTCPLNLCADGEDSSEPGSPCVPCSSDDGKEPCYLGGSPKCAVFCNGGTAECANGEDEAGCGDCTTAALPFSCPMDSTVVCAARCDGNPQCDGSNGAVDEVNCGCTLPETPCSDYDGTVNTVECAERCNADPECTDGSDEENCDPCDFDDKFKCTIGGAPPCIDHKNVCDGVEDCQYGEDEKYCETTCDNAKCQNGGSCFIEGFCTCPSSLDETGSACESADTNSDCCIGKCRVTLGDTEGNNVNTDTDLDCSDIPGTNSLCKCVKRKLCRCPPGFSGEFCEHCDLGCPINPCMNNGACILKPGTDDGYVCKCQPDYTGQNCETPLLGCCIEPCQNEGVCSPTPGEGLGYVCNCPAGYIGQNCEIQENICAMNPCKHDGTCMEAPNHPDGFKCICTEDWEGTYCQTSCRTVATPTYNKPTYNAPTYNAPKGYSNSYKKQPYGGSRSNYGYDAAEATEATKDSGKSVKSSSKTIKGYSGGKTRSKTGGRTGSKAPSKTASKAAFTRGIKKASSANTKAKRVKKTGRGQNFVNDYGYYGLDF